MDRRDFLKAGAIGVVALASPKAGAQETPTDPTKLLVTMGNDQWEPTPEDLLTIQELFQTWLEDPKNSTLVVCHGIKCQAGHLAEIKTLQIDHKAFNDWKSSRVEVKR